jgi:transposase
MILFKIKMYPLSEEHRWYIISELKKGSINVRQTARFLNCHINSVYRIINHYQCHGNVNSECGPGRPPALKPAQVKKLDETIRQNRSATAASLLTITRFNTTERTIQRYRRDLGYKPRKSVVKVKTNKMNEHNRFEFASLHHRANIKKYIFEDECYIGLRNTSQIVWCKWGEATPRKEILSLRAHINLIGFVWWDGCVFRRFNHWLNGDTYCATVGEALSEDIEALNGFTYVSDGISWHRSTQFRRWCEENDIELCDWPGYSADFNAIELVWNIIKQEVKAKNPKSQRELENAADEACSNLSLNVIRSCIEKTQTIYSDVVFSY